jgi:hypothetical protein
MRIERQVLEENRKLLMITIKHFNAQVTCLELDQVFFGQKKLLSKTNLPLALILRLTHVPNVKKTKVF